MGLILWWKKPHPGNKLFPTRVELMFLSTMAPFCKLFLHGILLGNQREVSEIETQEKRQLESTLQIAKILRLLSRPEGNRGYYLHAICITHEPRAAVDCRFTIHSLSLTYFLSVRSSPQILLNSYGSPQESWRSTPWTNPQGYHMSIYHFPPFYPAQSGHVSCCASTVLSALTSVLKGTVFSWCRLVHNFAADVSVLSKCHREILVKPLFVWVFFFFFSFS